MKNEKSTDSDEINYRKKFIKRELDRLAAIPAENILPEVLPFVRQYEKNLGDELAKLEGR